MTTSPRRRRKFLLSNKLIMDTETSEPQTHLEMEPVKKGTDQLCESIVNQVKFQPEKTFKTIYNPTPLILQGRI